MALVICGNLTPEQVYAVCERVLPSTPRDSYVEYAPLSEPADICTSLWEGTADVSQPLVEIGLKDLPSADPLEGMRICAANAITMQLLFGASGAFYNQLYESGQIHELSASYQQDRVMAMTEITAICKDPAALHAQICAEIERRQAQYFTPAEFETAKRVVYANNLFNFDSVEDIACSFMQFWQKGGNYLAYSALLSEIGLEEAKQIFCQTVRTDRCAMSVLYPNEKELLNV